MKNKSLIVTITVVTALSLGILTGCGAYQQANADPLTNPTQIEQTIEIEDETETQESTESTQESKDSSETTQETSTEQQELQNQDADPTEESHSHNDNDNKPTTTETTDSKPSTEQAHTHTWVTETRYRTVHHDAVYENQTIIDQAAWDETVVDQAAWDETVTTYTTETHSIEMCHCNCCGYCGTFDQMQAHMNSDINCAFAGFDTYYETVSEQVPHTETVHHDAVTHVVHHDAVTHTEKVLVTDAYDEQVPYTVEVCSECHQDRK